MSGGAAGLAGWAAALVAKVRAATNNKLLRTADLWGKPGKFTNLRIDELIARLIAAIRK
jgi:hypothetical protein